MTDGCVKQCGLFDFMANKMGIRVLHPGGYGSTRELCRMLGLDQSMHVLDLACGAGTTAFFVHENYGCEVTGIDIDEGLIRLSQQSLDSKSYRNRVRFEVADARSLPFEDGTFDVVISQAFFILVDGRQEILEEITRVIKPSGRLGSLELSWFDLPGDEAYADLLLNTCSDFIPRVQAFDEWEAFFASADLVHLGTSRHAMTSGMMKMVRSEGLINTVRIMSKMIGNASHRKRMMRVQESFGRHTDELGFGLYCYEKPAT